MNVSLRMGDLELRNPWLARDGIEMDPDRLEIVRWHRPVAGGNEQCYTLATWEQSKAGYYELRYESKRPLLEQVDAETFKRLAQLGQLVIDAASDWWTGSFQHAEVDAPKFMARGLEGPLTRTAYQRHRARIVEKLDGVMDRLERIAEDGFFHRYARSNRYVQACRPVVQMARGNMILWREV